MRYSEAKQGRVFVVRLEDGDVVHEIIESFAREKNITAAVLVAVGGADEGSRLVVGPKQGRGHPVVPMEHALGAVHEVAGTGTLFPDDEGHPTLHMHMACGRQTNSIVGCVRRGVKTWHIMEIVLFELTDSSAKRMPDSQTGFKLLMP